MNTLATNIVHIITSDITRNRILEREIFQKCIDKTHRVKYKMLFFFFFFIKKRKEETLMVGNLDEIKRNNARKTTFHAQIMNNFLTLRG